MGKKTMLNHMYDLLKLEEHHRLQTVGKDK